MKAFQVIKYLKFRQLSPSKRDFGQCSFVPKFSSFRDGLESRGQTACAEKLEASSGAG
jgi:hypothetical protein